MKKIIIVIAMVLAVSFVFGQGVGSAPTVENVEMRQTGGIVSVTYDLSYVDDIPPTSHVTLIIHGFGGPTFNIFPMQAYLSGAIGSGVAAGNGKEIIWHIHDQYLSEGGQGLIGENFLARVIARREGADTPEGDSEFVTIQGTSGVTFNPGGYGYFNPGSVERYKVSLSSFQIGRYDVTRAEYAAVMLVNPFEFIGDPYPPVAKVSWFDTVEFCNRRSIMEGLTPCYSYDDGTNYGTNPDDWPPFFYMTEANHNNISCNWDAEGYRLLTEMEWEFAARGGVPAANAGTFNHMYAGTNEPGLGEGQLGDYAWYWDNSPIDGFLKKHPVGTKLPNELGLYDMSGNVYNWVWDMTDWPATPYPTGDHTNPTGPTTGLYRVRRGGSYAAEAFWCNVSIRGVDYVTRRSPYYGFRIARRIP